MIAAGARKMPAMPVAAALAWALTLAAAAQPDIIDSGQTLAATLRQPGATNAFAFSARAGERVKIRMMEIDPWISPKLRLLDSTGCCVAYADSCCEYRGAQINMRLPRAGRYTIVCRDRGAAVGRYSISMLRIPSLQLADDDGDIGEISVGEKRPGNINQPGDLDAAVFTGRGGDHLLIRMEETDVSVGPYLQLYDSRGADLASADCPAPYALAEIDARLPHDDTYTIVCQDRYVNTGRYSLVILRLDDGSRWAPPAKWWHPVLGTLAVWRQVMQRGRGEP